MTVLGDIVTGIESSALRAGSAVVGRVATAWLAERKAEARRGTDLTELLALRFGSLRQRDRNSFRRKLDEIGDLAGTRLQELCEHEFAALADNERTAALDAVVDALEEADLSDPVLLGSDLDPVELARQVRGRVPTPRRTGLNEAGQTLFDRALDHSCIQLVHLVRELPEFDARLAEESLRRATSVLSGIDRILDRIPVTSLDAPAGTTHDEQFTGRYLDLVSRHYDDLELIGVSVRNFRPRTTLSVAYLSLTVQRESGNQRRDADTLLDGAWFGHGATEYATSAVRVEGALSAAKRMLVRGEAGSGKSTLLRWLAITAARQEFSHDLAEWNRCVPFLIKLRSYAGQRLPQPDEFLAEPSGPINIPAPAGWTHRQLATGRALVLVDGVDELAAGERSKVHRWLRSLLTTYPHIRIVITSRPPAAGSGWLESEDFATVGLERMNPSDVREFLERWHRSLLAAADLKGTLPFSHEEVAAHQRGLLTQLDARSHLRNLTRTPLMCAMLCALHLDRGGDLPKDRKSLYEAALEMLLDRRETARDIPSRQEAVLPYRYKLALLQDLAFWLNLNGRSELDRSTATELIERKLRTLPDAEIDAEDCLNALLERSGVIREAVEGRVDFVHRTFQEFLAAREAADDGHVGLLTEKAHSDQWRETVIMAAGLLNRPDRTRLLSGILDRADRANRKLRRKLRLLAATCRESMHDLPEDVRARLDENIAELVPPRTTRESRSLATVGEAIIDRMPTDLSNLSASQAAACVFTTALVNGPGSLRLLKKYASDPRVEVQDELIDAWALYPPDEYAREVLADAPLHNGQIRIRNSHLLGHSNQLNHLTGTHVDLGSWPEPDLGALQAERNLRSVSISSEHDIGVAELTRHQTLRRISIVTRGRIQDISSLANLTNVDHLFINQAAPLREIGFLQHLGNLDFLRIGPLDDNTDLRPLSELARLRALLLSGGDYVSALSQLPRPDLLRQLVIFHRAVSNDSPTRLIGNRFPNLSDLTIPTELLGPGLDELSELRHLTLTRPAEADLSQLARIPQLRQLRLLLTDTVDLTNLRNAGLTVKVHAGTKIQGEESLPESVVVQRITKRLEPEQIRKASRGIYDRYAD